VGSAGLLEFDFHIENDSMGSNGILSKHTSDPDLIKYGLLYNQYTLNDNREISNDGWTVPTYDQLLELLDYGGGDLSGYFLGIKSKETGDAHWDDNSLDSTNEFKLNIRGAGSRAINGSFKNQRKFAAIAGKTFLAPEVSGFPYGYLGFMSYSLSTDADSASSATGLSTRLLRNATESEQMLEDGTNCASYVGNDGKIYRTVKIDKYIWLADNLAETKFRNGDWIHGFDNGDYTPISNTDWAALETAGCCAYNDDLNNV